MHKQELRHEPKPEPQLAVTVVIQTLGFGGAETFWIDLLEEWRQQRIDLHLYLTQAELSQKLVQRGFSVTHLPMIVDLVGNWKGLLKALLTWPFVLGQYWWLARRERGTNVLIMSGFSEKIALSPLAFWYGIPVVWIEFAPLSSVWKRMLWTPKLLYRLVQRLPKQVITSSTYSYQWLITDGGFPSQLVTHIPCGRDIDATSYVSSKFNPPAASNFSPKTKSPAATMLSRFVRLAQPAVVCVSRLEKGKGQDVLIKAWPQVVAHHPGAHLYLIGEGDFGQELEKSIKLERLEQSVSLLGKVDDALAYMAQAQVCVFPSLWQLEGFGLVTIEAMALNVPVVAFNRGPTTDIIQHQVNGLLAVEGNVDDLAKQILRLLGDPELAQKLSRRAKRDFKERYTIAEVARRYQEVLAAAVAVA